MTSPPGFVQFDLFSPSPDNFAKRENCPPAWPNLSYLKDCPRLEVAFCGDCLGVLPDCEAGRVQIERKWSAGICKCKSQSSPLTLPEVIRLSKQQMENSSCKRKTRSGKQQKKVN